MGESSWIIWQALNTITHTCERGRVSSDAQTHRRGSNVQGEAEAGAMQTQTKESQQPPKLEKAAPRPLEPPEGVGPC